MLADQPVHRAFRPALWLCILGFWAVAAEGAFLSNVPQAARQPDGTVLRLFATGDEYYNRLHDAAGFTVLRDPASGYLVYAVTVDGRLQSSGLVVGRDDPAAAGLQPGAMPDPRTLPAPDELYPASGRRMRVRAQGLGNAPEFSSINNLVIFIRFSDEGGGFQSLATYQMWFNSTAANEVSMHRYFLEASYNLLDVSSSFYPTPDGSTIVSFQDSHARNYYTPYNATTNPDGYTDDQRTSREGALLQAAVNAVAAQVPVSLNLDTNGDGLVDNVTFIVSGQAVNADWANLLWPHRSALTASAFPAYVNGKRVADYNFQLDGNLGVGVLCHEMSHTLGAPDLYHYSNCSSAGGLDPVGPWDVMATTKNPPQHASAFLKWSYLGFLSSIPLLTPPATVTLNPLTSASNNAFRIASPDSTSEYFIIEYRKRSFPFENSLPDSGLLVYRVTSADGLHGNSCGPPDELYVYRPDGTPTANGNPNKANFASGTVPPRTAINDGTNPSSFLSNGFPGGLSIRDIGTAGDTITFTVDTVAPCGAPGAFSLTSPANGASVPVGGPVNLSWAASPGADSYDVFVGTSQDPPLLANVTTTGTTAGPFADGATVFWRVVARNACNQTAAPASGTWAFSAGGTAGVVTIFADGFEQGLPGSWQLLPSRPATGWGVSSFRSATGASSAWCAAGGSSPQPAGGSYAPNMNTWMMYGPFSLADARQASMEFDIWYDIEPQNDRVMWMLSVDGTHFNGYQAWDTNDGYPGWEHVTFDFSSVTSYQAIGAPQVWVAFIFQSNGSVERQGAYVDNVVIKKVVGDAAPTPRVRRHLPRK